MYRVILTSDQAKEARAKLGISQGNVAISVGLNRTYLSLFENGKYLLSDNDLKKLFAYYLERGAITDESKLTNDSEFDNMEVSRTGGSQKLDIRVMDGFVIPANMEDVLVERILSMYAENAEKIRRLCEYEIRKHHTSEPVLFWDGELDEAEVKRRTEEILVLMAKNFVHIETLRGHEFGIQYVEGSNTKLNTTGDFVWAQLR